MDQPADLREALETDRALAARHGIEFSVVGRPRGSTPPHPGPAPHHGTFTNPGDAVTLARSITDHEITILVNGRGAYWHTSAPDQVDSKLLRLVCREHALGPREAERDHRRDALRHTIERLRADSVLGQAAALVPGSPDVDDATQRLMAELHLTRTQALHLLMNRHLHLLTTRGDQTLHDELTTTLAELEALGPTPDVDM